MKTILVPSDLSPASQNASSYAGHLCRELGAKMILLNVYMLPVPVSEIPYVMVTADEMQKAGEDSLKKDADTIYRDYGVEVEWIVRLGLASDEISDICRERNIDMVIMGMKGEGELDKLIGSTTIAVIRKSRIAVLIIPQETGYAPIRSIAYATDFSYQMNLACFRPLKFIAGHFGAKLQVVHVQKSGTEMTTNEIAGKQRLEQELEHLGHDQYTVEDSNIEHGLQMFMREHTPDILAMVAHKHNFLERLFSSNHTRAMVYKTRIPLLILQDKV
jgi:nucleotide-binding universal stress UspA family protein